MFFNSLPEHPKEKPPLTPILYSAAIFPGIGQFQQKRSTVGTIYFVITLFALALLVAMLVKHGPPVLRRVLDVLMQQGDEPSAALDDLKPMMRSALFLLVVYVANVYDVWYAWYRINLAWKNDQKPPPLPPSAA